MTDTKKKEEKAVYLPTTAELDLERRMDKEELTKEEYADKYSENVNGRDFTGDGNDTSGYVGVNPEYMNYANETDKPGKTDPESALGRLERQLQSGSAVAEAGPGAVSNPTDGGGSSVPVLYAALSGEDFENRVVTADELETEQKRLAAPNKDAEEDTSKKSPTPTPVKTATPVQHKTGK